MASRAHCFYCFESLAAHFERRERRSLEHLLDLYDRYQTRSQNLNIQNPAFEQKELTEDEGTDEEGPEDDEPVAERIPDVSKLQLPSISRLQAPSTTSRSSTSSSPSILSASSSTSQLTSSTSTSTSSTRPTYASRLSVNESYPVFVTWNTLSRSGHKSLRGCIGTFDALPLANGLSTYALTSALDDTRFSPIPASSVPSLACSITLLANFENCHDALDWVLGMHGLRISFTHRGRRYGATYLPDVAVEQGWNKEETLESLMRKAGWDGGSTPGVARRLLRGSSRSGDNQATTPWNEVIDFRAVRYTGLKANTSYAEWRDFLSWMENVELQAK